MALEKSDTAKLAKTSKGRRAVQRRDAKIIENPKTFLVLKGHASSEIVNKVLGELHILRKPFSRKLQRKNDVLPFEAGGETYIENLARLNDSSLFVLGNHTKKRPDNLIFGRTFGFRILDMIEFEIMHIRPMAGFKKPLLSSAGSVPCIMFNGDDYHSSETTEKIQSLFVDIFGKPQSVETLHLGGIDRIISFTLSVSDYPSPFVTLRQFHISLLKNQGSNLPKVDLVEVGPKLDLIVRRTQFAPDSLWRESMRVAIDPQAERRQKNISKNELGDKVGQIHVGKQDLSTIAIARMKALDRKRSRSHDEGNAQFDGDQEVVESGNNLESSPADFVQTGFAKERDAVAATLEESTKRFKSNGG